MTGRAVAAACLALVAAWAAAWSARSVERLTWIPGPKSAEERRADLMQSLGMTARSTHPDLAALEADSRRLAAAAPLDPSPFMVAGAVAAQRGDARAARRLYDAALARDPRFPAAHFMIAQDDLANDRPDAALDHLAAIGRLAGGASTPFTHALLDFAREPANQPVLARFLVRQPDNREALFNQMALDPTLARRMIALAGPRVTDEEPPGWLPTSLQGLVTSGDLAGAEAIWQRFSGQGDLRRAPIRDTDFQSPAPAPFGWTLESPEDGSVSASPKGLEFEAYGRQPGRLAWQWLLLSPGRYQLLSGVEGEAVGAVSWRLSCVSPPGLKLAQGTPSKPLAFSVPETCHVQALELWLNDGRSDAPADGRIRAVRLEAVR